MKTINVGAVRENPLERLRFLSEFTGFTAEDQKLLAGSVEVLGPALPGLLDALYEFLLGYDDTRRRFLGPQGEVDPAYLQVRKEHLTQWVLSTVTADDPKAFADYLTITGRRHTGVAGEPGRIVPPLYMVGLMSFVQTALTASVFKLMPGDPDKALKTALAWNKMLMIQLELFLKAMTPGWDDNLK